MSWVIGGSDPQLQQIVASLAAAPTSKQKLMDIGAKIAEAESSPNWMLSIDAYKLLGEIKGIALATSP